MKKILVWTAILFGVILYMKMSNMTPNDLAASAGQVAGSNSTTQGKTFGMILPTQARFQLGS